ncbi:DUF4375 domain-containing protein [Bradyrhizobium sp. Leo121]|uniref:DMP19 family protein n=1 Tax=Bradyrhizobium sp. Leo121 TaxID=1571195 RepID=UPI001028856F|nr:DUF4375 domain-containing protein [Bradyrhizobium sp. Leo121]RZN22532.1 hypothetical protein CWO90_32035 [Bradyrhizobium sp. Leo121]
MQMIENEEARRALEPQGVIAREILIPDADVAEDGDLVATVVDFVNWAIGPAHLVSGEIVAEAFWSYHADYYLAQVNNGGHGQFAHNGGMSEQTLDNCRRGLVEMGAKDYVAIFDEFMAIMKGDPRRAKAIQDGSGFGKIDPAIELLDKRFFALGDMTKLNAAWLRTLPALRSLPNDRLTAEREAVIARNSLLAARQDYLRQAKARFSASDPIQVAARATCAQERIAFEGVNAGLPVGDGQIAWTLSTSAGSRMLVMGHGIAVLRDNGSLRGQYFFETRDTYPAPVGDGEMRRALIDATSRDIRERMRSAAGERTSASPAQSRETILANFLSPAFNAFWGSFTAGSKRINTAITCPYVGHNPSLVSYVPRASSPLLAATEEHSLIRLIMANALWDSFLAADAFNDSMLEEPDRAAALLINLGAAATVAATSLRVLDTDRIAALAVLAPGDFEREQYNVRFQLLEIARWWFSFVPKAAAAFAEASFAQRSWMFSNVCFNHAQALAEALRPSVTSDLTEALVYFDREYPSMAIPSMEATYDLALKTCTSYFARSERHAKAWANVVAETRHMIMSANPYDEATVFVVTPDIVQVRTSEKLVGLIGVVENEVRARQVFYYRKEGARAAL